MTRLKLLGLACLLSASGWLASGCATQSREDSTIPWSRPAGWEGQAPGMGGFNTPGSGIR